MTLYDTHVSETEHVITKVVGLVIGCIVYYLFINSFVQQSEIEVYWDSLHDKGKTLFFDSVSDCQTGNSVSTFLTSFLNLDPSNF